MSVVDSIALINKYEEHIPFFVDELLKINKRKKYNKQLSLGEVLKNCKGIGTKKGNSIYNAWRINKVNDNNALLSNDVEETVFERLKKTLGKETAFERLKRINNGV